MQFKIAFICIAFLALASLASAKTFTRCSLAKVMHRLGVPKSELAVWTCIAQHESSYSTNKIGPKNANGSINFGLFQINSQYWCKSTIASSNGCGINCSRLLTDNIEKAVMCARKIKTLQSWNAWSTYSKCSGSLPSINSCFK